VQQRGTGGDDALARLRRLFAPDGAVVPPPRLLVVVRHVRA
jgi:hypothetical protein